MQGHVDLTRDVEKAAGALFFSDTDPLMTAAWQMMMFGVRSPELDAFSAVGDLYLLMDDDLEWIDDGLRVHASPEERAHFQALARAELERRDIRYVVISGNGERRRQEAIAAVQDLLDRRSCA